MPVTFAVAHQDESGIIRNLCPFVKIECQRVRAFDAAEDNDLATQLDLERKLQREAGSHEDYAEGVKAFLGKRKPVFTGKR